MSSIQPPSFNHLSQPSLLSNITFSVNSEIISSTLGESARTLSLAINPYGCNLSSDEEFIMGDTPNLPTLKANMRIRIVNEKSKRFKDLFISIDDDIMLYDCVYDSVAVKMAHVRKWGSDIVQKVKNGDAEIRCSVWDDVVQSPVYSFTVEELKSTSTRQLYQLVPESDIVKLVLQCVETSILEYSQPLSGNKDTDLFSASSSRAFDVQNMTSAGDGGNGRSASPLSSKRYSKYFLAASTILPDTDSVLASAQTASLVTKSCSALPSGDIIVPLKTDEISTCSSAASSLNRKMSPESGFLHQNPTGQSPDSPTKPKVRCPFSGISVDGKIFDDFQAQMQRKQSHAKFESPGSKLYAHGRQASCSPDRSPSTKNNLTPRFYNFHGHRRGSSCSGTPNPPPFVETNDFSDYSVAESDNTLTPPSIHDVLLMNGTHFSDHSVKEASKSTMRIRISNELSGRFKDLIVDIGANITLYESVYEHQALKNAHIRKWGTTVVRDVKKKVAEIQCVVLEGNGDDGKVSHSFSMDDLKKTSTKDLREMCPKSDPVRLVLKCVKKCRAVIDSNFNFSLALERGKIHAQTTKRALSSTNSRSEPCFAALQKSCPDLMNLSEMKNATFSATVRPMHQIKHSIDLSQNNGLSNGKVAAPQSQESIISSISADGVNLKKPREGSRTKEKFLASLSQGEPSNSKVPSFHDSDATLSATGLTPFAGNKEQSKPELKMRSPQSRECLDPVQLLQKYTNGSQCERLMTKTECANTFTIPMSERPVRSRESGPRETSTVESTGHEQKLQEFMRLCRSKKGPEQQSREKLYSQRTAEASKNGGENATFPPLDADALKSTPTFASIMVPVAALGVKNHDHLNSTDHLGKESQHTTSNPGTDRISRFLQFSAKRSQSDLSLRNDRGGDR